VGFIVNRNSLVAVEYLPRLFHSFLRVFLAIIAEVVITASAEVMDTSHRVVQMLK